MNFLTEFLIHHGYVLVFVWVFVEQIGVPIPAVPVLLAAGALSGSERLNLWIVAGAALAPALLSDLIWYRIGQRRGNTVLGLLCRVSLEPDSCARRTQNAYSRYGVKSLLLAKFIPWLNTAAPPLAGAFGMSPFKFLLFDLFGTLLWAGTYLSLGYLFSNQLEKVAYYADRLGSLLLVTLLLGVLGAYLIRRALQRRQFERQLRAARITPQELKQKLDAKEQLTIVDLRHPLDFLPQPYTIPGAIRIPMDKLQERIQDIPRDREVILYCTCPNEASSAMMANRLRKLGVLRVRPLTGGYFAWRKLGFPLESQFGPVPPLRETDALFANR